MKRKVLISFFVILLFLALTGCVAAQELTTDRSLAEEAVYNYWQAIINRQYELARCYCVFDGFWYNKVDEWEEYININSEDECSFLIIYFDKFYKPTEVIGDTAIVYIQVFVNKIPFPGSSVIYGDTFEYEVEVIQQDYPPGEFILK